MTRTMRIRLLLLALAAAITATALLLVAGGNQPAHGASDPAAVTQAQSLAAEPNLDRRAAPAYSGGEQARAAAARFAERVPLPDGGNLNGIQWEAAGGVFSAPEVETVIEANAVCQWLRALRDRRGESAARRVLDAAPGWPGLRDQDGFTASVVADVRAGGGERLEAALRDCDDAHEREVAYAKQMGLAPSA
ncbi:MAG: hypothetical protein ACJ762_02860 [Solirubrobacteraceae bacterium]